MDEIKIISDFEEKDYNLESIGVIGLHLSFEQGLIYFYSDVNDFYYEIDFNEIQKLLNTDIITIRDEEECYNFTIEQSQIIKEIFQNEYRGQPS
jgi:hypothetical protein